MRLSAWAGRWALSGFLLAGAVPAFAQSGPEQLDQIEPGAGEWQAEYFGAFGGDGEQGIEVLAGVSDRLALGGEVELEGPRGGLRLDTLSLTALYRAVDPEDHPVGLGIEVQASIGRDGNFAGAEARTIVEVRRRGWWAQADAILRQSREEGEQGTSVAYGASIQRSLGGDAWLGIETSGQLTRLSGISGLAPEGQHYAGPSLTLERTSGPAQIELGLAWLQRVRGQGPGSGPRIFAQFTF